MHRETGAVRTLGIDFGDRNIGLALSDPLELTAQPLGQFVLRSEPENKAYFCDLVSRHGVSRVIIGFPLRMDGSSGTRAQKTQEFAAWLEKITGLQVILWDERLTTQQAIGIMHEQKMKTRAKKKFEHQISAALILQCYLDRCRLQRDASQGR
jgi:putative Holliday junction resolvase